MRRNVVLSPYNSATYLDQTGNYVVKTCSQKFHLRLRFITRLNTFARVWACARAITRLSWKGLQRCFLKVSMRFSQGLQCIALPCLIEKWKNIVDYGVFGASLTDLSKAFDCVPQDLSMQNWKHMVTKQMH